MKLSELRSQLTDMKELNVLLPDGQQIPSHFHITELGLSTKHFLDCGNVERIERKATLQAWVATDIDHRLKAEKLVTIIDKAEPLFKEFDPEVEIEYQQDTLSKFGLEVKGGNLQLTTMETACLALENCGITPKVIDEIVSSSKEQCCPPSAGCC